MEDIHIEWDGAYMLDDLQTLHEASDYGVYQIYGSHPVYGSDVLLYIGKAALQTFGKRIGQELWQFNKDSGQIKIYVGRLGGCKAPSDDLWCDAIDRAERLLIYAHLPAHNSSGLNSIPNHRLLEAHVFNWGNFRDLLPEVSGGRWTTKFDDMPNYHVFGEEEEAV